VLGDVQSNDKVKVSTSPGNSIYYTPICPADVKPFVGQLFPLLEDVVQFYNRYACFVGFSVRKATDIKAYDGSGITTTKYLLCNRAGEKPSYKGTAAKRRRTSFLCGCTAKIIISYAGLSGYRVKTFVERHNHDFLIDSHKQFLK